MIATALKIARDEMTVADLKLINRSAKEMRSAAKIFAPFKHLRKVAVFGSARSVDDLRDYKMATDFACEMVRQGFMVIAGGRDGIMGAVQRGAGRAHSFALNIRLPSEQRVNELFEGDPKLVTLNYFFTRKLSFVKEANAFALLPGGFGTMDEGYEALTLMQTGKSQLMPLVLVDRPGGTYWKTWDKHIREHLLRDQLISPDDLNLYHITDNTDEAVKIITRFYRNFHSSRFVKDLFIVRLKHAPTASAIEAMNEDFADIMVGPQIQKISPTPEELEDGDNVDLPRIAFGFNRRDYGRLRQLYDVLNGL